MALYVMLGNLTREAFGKLESLEERDGKLKSLVESLGGKIVGLYYMIGRYDFVLIFDMPAKENLVKFLSIMGKYGTVRTETLETIPPDMLYRIAKEI
jgi:uncharacterized protein with GYD domain